MLGRSRWMPWLWWWLHKSVQVMKYYRTVQNKKDDTVTRNMSKLVEQTSFE